MQANAPKMEKKESEFVILDNEAFQDFKQDPNDAGQYMQQTQSVTDAYQ
jgi:hypothetical protein